MRTQLIDIYRTFGEDSSKDKLSKTISDLEIYINPHRRVESFIKSYAYRMIIEDLKTTSRVLSDSSIELIYPCPTSRSGIEFKCW